MYKYVVLCLCVSLSGALCDLNKEEGSACEWDGVKGKCVKRTQCLTTLDTRGDPHAKRGAYLHWKDGSRARDSCLEYLDTLPYKCRDGGFYSEISKYYDEAKKCHTIGLRGIEGALSPGHDPGAEYPHVALLAFGGVMASSDTLEAAGGSIISNKYILTGARFNTESMGPLMFVAVGIRKLSDGPAAWQRHSVKRYIQHPDYDSRYLYHDIALIETENTITFNKNVLPACLHVAAADDETAITTTWRYLTSVSFGQFADTIQTINLEKFSEEECKTAHGKRPLLKDGINYNTQMCYGSKSHVRETCWSPYGEPLLIKTQFSRCIHTVIGVSSFSKDTCGPNLTVPTVFTRVAPYIPWIESVVWA